MGPKKGIFMPNKLYYIRRDGLKKTLLDFYNESGMNVSRMADIERGKVVPNFDEVDILSRCYGISGQEVLAHIIDYIGIPCIACQEKYLKGELYVCEKCNQTVCEDCSSGDGEETYCPSCATSQG